MAPGSARVDVLPYFCRVRGHGWRVGCAGSITRYGGVDHAKPILRAALNRRAAFRNIYDIMARLHGGT